MSEEAEHLGNPWNSVRSNFEPRRTTKRRRRIPSQPPLCEGEGERGQEEEGARRKMRPAVPWMSVRDERKALQEIRNMSEPLRRAKEPLRSIDADMTVEEFALHYVIGHHSKRQQSVTSKRTVQQQR